ARRHWGRVSMAIRSRWVKARAHMACAAAPQPCKMPPPVVLGTTTLTQPLREPPWLPGSVAAHALTPPMMITSTTPTTANTRFCRGVNDSPSGFGCRPSMATQLRGAGGPVTGARPLGAASGQADGRPLAGSAVRGDAEPAFQPAELLCEHVQDRLPGQVG